MQKTEKMRRIRKFYHEFHFRHSENGNCEMKRERLKRQPRERETIFFDVDFACVCAVKVVSLIRKTCIKKSEKLTWNLGGKKSVCMFLRIAQSKSNNFCLKEKIAKFYLRN